MVINNKRLHVSKNILGQVIVLFAKKCLHMFEMILLANQIVHYKQKLNY